MNLINLVGKRFGRLLVVEKADSKKSHARWRCLCDCGKQCIVYGSELKSGNTTSCGCYKTENAKALYSSVRQNDKALYSVWNGIKQRCLNKNNKSYCLYPIADIVEVVKLPKISTIRGNVTITVETSLQPSNMELTYKVIE